MRNDKFGTLTFGVAEMKVLRTLLDKDIDYTAGRLAAAQREEKKPLRKHMTTVGSMQHSVIAMIELLEAPPDEDDVEVAGDIARAAVKFIAGVASANAGVLSEALRVHLCDTTSLTPDDFEAAKSGDAGGE